jgi:hypothetical protein
MLLQANYVDVYGHIANLHTFLSYFSRPSMVRWLLVLQPPPRISIPLDKDFNGYHLPEDVSKSWKTLEQSCRQSITVLRALFEEDHHPNPPSVVQLHPIPRSLATPKIIAPRVRLALPYLTPLTLSCFFSPMFPSALQFVGSLTTPPIYLQVRRHRRSPSGFSVCLSERAICRRMSQHGSIGVFRRSLNSLLKQTNNFFSLSLQVPPSSPGPTIFFAFIWYSNSNLHIQCPAPTWTVTNY